MALSDRIREIINESGLNQKKFAKAIGVSDSFISKVLRNETGISNARAQVIEGLYRFSRDWILNGTEPKKKVDSGRILTPLQIQIINSIEQMEDNELIEVLTYIETRQKNMKKWGIAPESEHEAEPEPDFATKKRA